MNFLNKIFDKIESIKWKWFEITPSWTIQTGYEEYEE